MNWAVLPVVALVWLTGWFLAFWVGWEKGRRWGYARRRNERLDEALRRAEEAFGIPSPRECAGGRNEGTMWDGV